MSRILRVLALAALPALTAVSPRAAGGGPDAAERQTARHFQSLRNAPQEQWAFLKAMPKGGDLHSHLSGAVYAESMLQWAANADLCIDSSTTAVPPPCNPAAGQRPAWAAFSDPALRREIIDAWSMRGWERSGRSGHQQFFGTFGKFRLATRGQRGGMLAEAAARAARGGVLYLELMETLDDGASARIAGRANLMAAAFATDRPGRFASAFEKLEQAGIREAVDAGLRGARRAEAEKDSLLGCTTGRPDPGCAVTIRWLYQVPREQPPAQVFAHIMTGFLLAEEPGSRVVGLNLVQPEDGHIAMRDFSLHMALLDFMRARYSRARISLHAGELAPGLVPPEGLAFHIRESVRTGHAERIGHGVAVMREDDARGLLREMREKQVLVEICLTSNDVILGVRGADHPLAVYRKHGIPVALATDDEGVSRSEMTAEYLRAVREQGLGYSDLKAMARHSLRYAFVEEPEKARLREELEKRFREFEKSHQGK